MCKSTTKHISSSINTTQLFKSFFPCHQTLKSHKRRNRQSCFDIDNNRGRKSTSFVKMISVALMDLSYKMNKACLHAHTNGEICDRLKWIIQLFWWKVAWTELFHGSTKCKQSLGSNGLPHPLLVKPRSPFLRPVWFRTGSIWGENCVFWCVRK